MLTKIYEDKTTKVFVNTSFRPDIDTWNIIFHKDKNKKIQFKNKLYEVKEVLYHWKWGYYYSLVVSNGKIKFKIPYKNISCCVPKIKNIIEANKKCLVILNKE